MNQGLDYADLADTAYTLEVKYAYNQDKAREIINAEMTSMNASLNVDGKWVFNGGPVTLIFLIRKDGDLTRRLLGDYAADQLETAGFTIDRQYLNGSEANPIWRGTNPADGLWSIYTAGWLDYRLMRDEKYVFQENYLKTSDYALGVFQANEADPVFQQVGDDLANGNFTTFAQRRQMMAQALALSMQDSLQVWLIELKFLSPYRPKVRVAYDLAGGIGGAQVWPYSLRFNGQEGGTLKWGDSDLFTEPWNPVAGSNWAWDLAAINATRSGGVMNDPYTGLARPLRIESAEVTAQQGLTIRKSLEWVTLDFVPQVNVPGDAFIDWNASTQTFVTAAEKYPAGLTAKIKSVVRYPADLFETVSWQDGNPLSAADFLMRMIMIFERANPASRIYDVTTEEAFDNFMQAFRGFRITGTSPLTVEYYSNAYTLDAELDAATLWPAYSTGEASWDVIAVANAAEAAGDLAYSADKAAANSIEQTNFVGGPGMTILANALDQVIADKTVPYAATLGAYITPDQAAARYANLKSWYATHNHFWVGTGPYYIDSADLSGKTLVLKNNPAYPDLADRWSVFDEPRIAEVTLTGPTFLNQYITPTFDIDVTFQGNPYPAVEVEKVDYLLINANREVKGEGSATFVVDGHYQVKLSRSDLTALLYGGKCNMEVIVTVRPVSVPTFASHSIVVNEGHAIFLPLVLR